MTLNWTQTAHDCRVAEFMAPRVLEHFTLRPNMTWAFLPESPLARPRGVTGYLDDFLVTAGRDLPEIRFWDRTRSRLITKHGTYQIRREVTWYVDRGMMCRCWGPCRHPSAPEVHEPGHLTLPALPEITQAEVDWVLDA